MKRAAVFPYNHDFDTLIRFQHLLIDYRIVAMVSFIEDKYYLEHCSSDYGIQTSSDLKEIIGEVDSIVLLDNLLGVEKDNYRMVIDIALSNKKEILLSPELANELGLYDKHNNIILLQKTKQWNELKDLNRIFEISLPVISVLGIGEHCDKFKLQLIIKEELEKKGYHPVVFCSNALGALFGMYTLPPFLFNKTGISFEERVLRFNHILYQICKEKLYDQIIIGFPGGIVPFGPRESNHFAEIPSILSNAVHTDAAIVNTFIPEWLDDEYFDKISNYCFYKFNCAVAAFGISEQKLDYNEETDQHNPLFLENELAQLLYNKNIENNTLNTILINISDIKDAQKGINEIINELEKNPPVL